MNEKIMRSERIFIIMKYNAQEKKEFFFHLFCNFPTMLCYFLAKTPLKLPQYYLYSILYTPSQILSKSTIIIIKPPLVMEIFCFNH